MGKLVMRDGKFPPLTDEQIEMLNNLADSTINYDDIPKLSDEQLKQFKRVTPRLQIA